LKKTQDWLKRIIQDDLNDFEITVSGDRGTHERLVYFRSMSRWYSDQSNALVDKLSGCRASIKSLDLQWRQWELGLRERLPLEIKKLYSTSEKGSDFLYIWDILSRSSSWDDGLVNNAYTNCHVSNIPNRPPEPPRPGSEWGVFGTLTGWLLSTQSQSLALITGMLGFGLLGSAVASFVREPTESAGEGGRSRNLSRLVVRGVSAAVILFLAVKGGIAIFTTSEAQPNAYVLFFMCFVGAVYGEAVWEWARQGLRDRLQGDPSDDARKGRKDESSGSSETNDSTDRNTTDTSETR
jgi:hypothetical protein